MQGRKIQNYIIDDKIGEGGMGAVFKAHHALMPERKAAIKMLNAQYAGNQHLKERFKNEAAALARLNHSGIVALYDYIEEGQEAFLVMEFAEGTPLDKMIERNGKLDEKFALQILRQIAEALAYAHSQGIVHRDIKPSNFIVSAEGKVKILDFGIAKMVAESRHLTKTGMRMGSVYFMSPEQVRGDKDINHRTDLYSLGLMYYVMLTGVYPLEGLTSEYAIYDAVVNKDFVNLQELKGKVSPVSLFVLEKCLQRNPQDRFATALDIVKAIDNPQEIVKETPKPSVSEIAKKEIPITEKPQLSSSTKLNVHLHFFKILKSNIKNLCISVQSVKSVFQKSISTQILRIRRIKHRLNTRQNIFSNFYRSTKVRLILLRYLQPSTPQKAEKPFTHPSVVSAPKKKNNKLRNFLIIVRNFLIIVIGGLLFAICWNKIYFWIAITIYLLVKLHKKNYT